MPEDNKDDLGYSKFLSSIGVTSDELWLFINKLPPVTPHPEIESSFKLALSPIHGIGVFASRDLNQDETFPVNHGETRYALARYTNHSDKPNSLVFFDDQGNGWLTTLIPIYEGEEITLDYNDNLEKAFKVK